MIFMVFVGESVQECSGRRRVLSRVVVRKNEIENVRWSHCLAVHQVEVSNHSLLPLHAFWFVCLCVLGCEYRLK
jgi:hypothetical protein